MNKAQLNKQLVFWANSATDTLDGKNPSELVGKEFKVKVPYKWHWIYMSVRVKEDDEE